MKLDICICTFRRDSLADALRSVLSQTIPEGVEAGVIVADNDDTPSARDIVARFAEGAALPVRYVHCPARNISIARNAALAASDARFAAFLDDDETAEPGWIAALMATAASTGAEAVLGPVEARYRDGAPDWMRRAAIHDTRPVYVDGRIRTGYTCNVLIDRARPAIRGLRFDTALGRSGGEDTDFFSALHGLGGRIAHAPDARVTEVVLEARATFRWLARRHFRMGQTHARVLLRHDGKGRIGAMALAAAKVAACGGLVLAAAADPVRRNRAVLRGCLHAGVVTGLAGRRMAAIYGVTEAGTA
ncbi:glycosyltransferase [Rhodobacterales bacterium HKCCE2091]|nr:glycosyltransferase [Rhodobacterales bacterium HKCCE2091]